MLPGSAWLRCSLGLLIFFPCLVGNTGITHLEWTGGPESQESSLQRAGHPESELRAAGSYSPAAAARGGMSGASPLRAPLLPARDRRREKRPPCPHLRAGELPRWWLRADKSGREGSVAGASSPRGAASPWTPSPGAPSQGDGRRRDPPGSAAKKPSQAG